MPDTRDFEMETYKAVGMVRDYVCAQCWGRLTTSKVPNSRNLKVFCPKCGEDRGFVTYDYKDRRLAESALEEFEVSRNLASAMGMDQKN